MSLLGNQNNDFEKKLKKQLGDTEFRPAESLWSRIDREVNRPEFEEKVEGKVGNYTLKPYPETWEQIEAQLPPEPNGYRRRRLYWFGALVALLFVTGFGAGYLLNNEGDQTSAIMLNEEHSTDGVNTQAEASEMKSTATDARQTHKELEVKSPNATAQQHNRKADQSKRLVVESQAVITKPEASNGEEKEENHSTQTILKASATPHRQKADSRVDVFPEKSIRTLSIGAQKPESTIAHRDQSSEENRAIADTQRMSSSAASVFSGQSQSLPDEVVTQNKTNGVDDKKNDGMQRSSESVLAQSNKPEAPQLKQEQDLVQLPSDSGKKVVAPYNSPIGANKLTPLHDSVQGRSATVADDKPASLTRLSISVLAGAHYNLMQLTSPSDKFNDVLRLRKQIESPKIDWSGGFLVDYHINEHWMVSSGIMFTHFSMNMSYGTEKASQKPVYEQGGRYSMTDSVTADGVNNTRIKYSWNEIPLLMTYRFNPSRRFGIEAKGGISYAMLNVVDAAMVGQNNVGLFVLKNQEAFPVLNNSWFVQGYLGMTYRLNETVTLSLMPYAKFSINGMVEKHDWIQQKPYMLGLSAGLRKHF